METALYFPYMRVPKTSWFTQVLLYRDAAASIVPRDLHYNEPFLGEYTAELASAGLLEFVDPFQYEPMELSADFLNLLDAYAPPPVDSANAPSRWAPATPLNWTHVYHSKVEHMLFDELAYRGLARRDREGEWYEIEEVTAGIYMGYLAGLICGEHQGFSPVTDNSQSVALLGRSDQETAEQLRTLRYTVIEQALPMPSHPVPVRELMSFKEGHGDELRRLRVYLDAQLADIVDVRDEVLQRVKIDGVLQDIEDQVETLTEHMNKRRWPRVIRSGVGGVVGASLGLGGTVLSGGAALVFALAVASGAIGVGLSVKDAYSVLRSPRYDKKAPMVYAALTQQL